MNKIRGKNGWIMLRIALNVPQASTYMRTGDSFAEVGQVIGCTIYSWLPYMTSNDEN